MSNTLNSTRVSFYQMVRQPFRDLSSNARIMLLTEPLFGIIWIPLAVYLPIYMKESGLSEAQIGWVTFYTVLGQLCRVPWGGYIADHWGRKRATIFTSFIRWTLFYFILFWAHSFWMFAIAGFIFGVGLLSMPGWLCLFTEDATPEQTRNAFSILWVINAGNGIFSPTVGILIHKYGTIHACRILILIGMVTIVIANLFRWHYTKETHSERKLILAEAGYTLKIYLRTNWQALKWIVNQPIVRILLLLGVVYGASNVV